MFVLGMDIGYSNLKVCYGPANGLGGVPNTKVLPVGAGPKRLLAESLKSRQDGFEVVVDGQEYIACVEPEKLAHWKRALHDDYPATLSYRALFYAALRITEQGIVNHLVTGLPVSHFRDENRRKALKKRLEGIHLLADGYAVRVANCSVVPQPVGAYLDAAASSGRAEEFAESETLVIDPGFFSVDWLLLNGEDVQYEYSGSSALATSRLIEEVCRLVQSKHDCRISVERIERAIRSGRKEIPIFGERVPLAPLLAEAAGEVGGMVMNSVMASMRTKGTDVGTVILAGGGASFYESAVREIFPRADVFIPVSAVEANARGFWHFGVM